MGHSPWEAISQSSQSSSQEIPRLYGTRWFIPFSQGPGTGLYPEPDASSPQLLILFQMIDGNDVLYMLHGDEWDFLEIITGC
jgi:hypothetical protein